MTTLRRRAVQEIVLEYVFVNGVQIYNAEVVSINTSAGPNPGTAVVRVTASHYYHRQLETDDEIEIYLGDWRRFAPVFRGFVLGPHRNTFGDIEFECLDLRGRLDDLQVRFDYNQPDEFSEQVAEADQLNARAVLGDLQRQFVEFKGSGTKLNFKSGSFPDKYPGTLNLMGNSLGGAIQTLLFGATGGKYRLRLVHYYNHSELEAWEIASGPAAYVTIATQPTYAPPDQPAGVANVGAIEIQDEESEVVNDVRALGGRQMIETAVTLTKAWDTTRLDPTEQEILDNWNRWTRKEIEGNTNPDYDASMRLVGTRYLIPEYDDTWDEYGDGSNVGTQRRPKILPELVQDHYLRDTGGARRKMSPFLIYKYAGDEEYTIKDDGFTPVNDQWVELDSPLVKQIKLMLLKGVDGTPLENGGAWDKYQSAGTDFAAEGVEPGSNDYWLVESSKKLAYAVTTVATDTLTVTGGSLEDASGNWLLYKDFNPVVENGAGGSGDVNGEYTTGTTMVAHEYRGFSVTIGSTYAAGATQYKVYRVVDNDTAKLYVNAKPNLTGVSATWSLFGNQTQTAELPTVVRFNYAFMSDRRLEYESGKQGSANTHRQKHFLAEQYYWRSQIGNLLLSYNEDDDKLSYIDHVGETSPHAEDKLDDELEGWALDQVARTQDAMRFITVTLPRMDLQYAVGQRLFLNGRDMNADILEIGIHPRQHITVIRAANA